MKKSVLRTVLVIVVAAMMLSMFAACSSGSTSADKTASTVASTAASTTSAPAAVTWENAPTITVMRSDATAAQRTASKLDPVDNTYTRYIFEKTGVKIKIDWQAGEGDAYNEKVYLTLASGSAPDLMFLGGDDQFAQKIARSGALEPLNSVIDKYSNINKVYNADYWKEFSFDSNKYFLKGVLTTPVNQRCTLIRQDWLDKLKLPMPATVDELFNTAKAFIASKPDGQPVLGLTGRSNFSYFYTLSTAYGCPNYDLQKGYTFIDKANKKLVFWNTTDAARAYFTQCEKWNKAGMIDPELITAQGANFWNKVDNGNVGIISYRADSAGWLSTEIRQSQKKSTAILAVLAALKGTGFKDPDGTSEGFIESDNPFEGYWAVPRTTKNIDNILKVFDWQDSAEGTLFTVLGMEGIEWHKDSNGAMVLDKDNSNKVGFSGDYSFTSDRTATTPEMQAILDQSNSGGGDLTNNPSFDPPADALARYKAAFAINDTQVVPPQRWAATIPQLPEQDQFNDVANTYLALYVKMITGETDASKDADWQAYLKAVDDAGINVINKAKEAYLLQNKPELFQ